MWNKTAAELLYRHQGGSSRETCQTDDNGNTHGKPSETGRYVGHGDGIESYGGE
jgi:hypothetical protein